MSDANVPPGTPPTTPPPAAPAAGMPAAKPSSVMSIIALIGGILGLLLACCFGAGFLFALAGIVLGHLGLKREPHAKGMAMTGLITGYAGAVLSILIWILLLAAPALLAPLLFIPGMEALY